jgi:hypothetical protein
VIAKQSAFETQATHAPSLQVSLGAVHASLQAPQWLGLDSVSTHWSPHKLPVGAGQVHTPTLHVWIETQALPQPPQWLVSSDVSTHVTPQSSSGWTHVQSLSMQLCVDGQLTPVPHSLQVPFTHFGSALGQSGSATHPTQVPALHSGVEPVHAV